MLTSETKRRINACRDILVGKLPQPAQQVELITLALIYKFMDDLDEESVANKPEEFWSQAKLRDLFRTDRLPSFREVLQFIFGVTPEIARREQLAKEHFERMLTTHVVDATKIRELRQVFHAYVLDGEIRTLLRGGDFAALRTRDAGLFQSVKALGAESLKALLAYIEISVPLEEFVRVA